MLFTQPIGVSTNQPMEFLLFRQDCGWSLHDRHEWTRPSVEIHILPTNKRYISCLCSCENKNHFSHHDVCPDNVGRNDRNIPLQRSTRAKNKLCIKVKISNTLCMEASLALPSQWLSAWHTAQGQSPRLQLLP